MNCAASTVKYLLFFFNFLIFLCGIALLVPGVIALIELADKSEFLDSKFNVPAIVVTSMGGILLVVGFFGCCGAIKENRCMTNTYTWLVILIVVVEIAIGITAFVFRDDINGILTDKLLGYTTTYESLTQDQKDAVDGLQQGLECCGANSFQEYGGLLPDSCCIQGPCSYPGNVYGQSCSDKMKELISSMSDLIGGIAIGIGAVEIIVIVFSCCLSRSMKD